MVVLGFILEVLFIICGTLVASAALAYIILIYIVTKHDAVLYKMQDHDFDKSPPEETIGFLYDLQQELSSYNKFDSSLFLLAIEILLTTHRVFKDKPPRLN